MLCAVTVGEGQLVAAHLHRAGDLLASGSRQKQVKKTAVAAVICHRSLFVLPYLRLRSF